MGIPFAAAADQLWSRWAGLPASSGLVWRLLLIPQLHDPCSAPIRQRSCGAEVALVIELSKTLLESIALVVNNSGLDSADVS